MNKITTLFLLMILTSTLHSQSDVTGTYYSNSFAATSIELRYDFGVIWTNLGISDSTYIYKEVKASSKNEIWILHTGLNYQAIPRNYTYFKDSCKLILFRTQENTIDTKNTTKGKFIRNSVQ